MRLPVFPLPRGAGRARAGKRGYTVLNNIVLKGNILWSESPDVLQTSENSYLVCEDGLCAGVFRELPAKYAHFRLRDCGGKLIVPGMTDLHVHAPQFAFRGLGMDMELLDWLNTYTFPEEAKYADLDYASRAYESFVRHLLKSTTTRASIFATLHVPATELLMRRLDETGLVTCVGKVNMNRGCPVYLGEVSTNQAVRDTERWILETRSRFSYSHDICEFVLHNTIS